MKKRLGHSSTAAANRYLHALDGQDAEVAKAPSELARRANSAQSTPPCDTQDEVDRYWSQLTEGGEEGRCGWLKDKYGLSWQIIPALLFELTSDPDPVKSQAVMAAMLKMGKFDSGAL